MQRSKLGTIPFDLENNSGVITDEKKEILKSYGIKMWDISHYRKKNFQLIGKKKLIIMKRIIESEVVHSKHFKPLEVGKVFAGNEQFFLIQKGIN